MRPKVGERAGAIVGERNGVLRLFGYGVYDGDFVPEEDVGGLGPLIREVGNTNPRIRLDSGEAVYGCESWWGAEERIRATVAAREAAGVRIELVDPTTVRAQYARD